MNNLIFRYFVQYMRGIEWLRYLPCLLQWSGYGNCLYCRWHAKSCFIYSYPSKYEISLLIITIFFLTFWVQSLHFSICTNIQAPSDYAWNEYLKFSSPQTKVKATGSVKAMQFSLNKANKAATKAFAEFSESLPTRRWIHSLEIMEPFPDFSGAGISLSATLPFVFLLRFCF